MPALWRCPAIKRLWRAAKGYLQCVTSKEITLDGWLCLLYYAEKSGNKHFKECVHLIILTFKKIIFTE